jgi:transcriptional regulator
MPDPSRPKGPLPGTLGFLILRVLQAGPLHGYAIAQRLHQLSNRELAVEEGSLYPALQRLLANGWVAGEWGTSEHGRRVRTYRLTKAGARQLKVETSEFERAAAVIRTILETA